MAHSPSDAELAARFFIGLGGNVRRLREGAGYSQEDMISFGYTVRYWQRVERGKPITLRTLLRICGIFGVSVQDLVRGLGPERVESSAKTPKVLKHSRGRGEA